jgi:hypothetical protein
MKKKIQRKATGRPRLVEDDDTIRVGFTVPEQFWAKVIAQADREGVCHSKLVRRALVAYLKQNEQEAAS